MFALKNIEVLHLSRNEICNDVEDVYKFFDGLSIYIKMLSFQGNPVCTHMSNYRRTMLAIITSLINLDGKPIRHFEHDDVEMWMRSGLHDYS